MQVFFASSIQQMHVCSPGFFVGLGSRSVWAACIISGQFFLYDVCKSFLGVKDPGLIHTVSSMEPRILLDILQDLRMFLNVQV